ncbi:putative surface antigen protein [Leishmania mexicana MHOM/GT/2001/U1103]|uniref:Surface antigen protein n=1 Tax=Leishmania mexicana (strain MHOM/GT/2001/U1103) TaxID=929439 RepID=E9AP08_LEIMU|nr:putative surface antigen protein [Leishmania mexicana MHOM/GT/2001/U1103]CBZ24672.1 putative surface antigen protein [Leishmania mexicana MHOM/GT/2001/U1103]
MAQCVRRLVLAAPLAAVVALLLCTSSAPVARAAGTSDFTGAQQKNTLTVLRAFARAIPELGKKWTGSDFCSWNFVTCYSSGVSVWMDKVDYTGTLPEMPSGVDYKDVMIMALNFSAMGQGLSGTLPASWSSLTSLMSLWIEKSEKVTGTLPAQWSSMTSLGNLNLRFTKVSGTLPAQWSSMKQLTLLHLEGTKVFGTLPAQWSSMTSLGNLNLRFTAVSGTLPAQWSGMTSAEALQLEYCGLSGCLPPEWSAMPRLAFLSLSGNHFSGCVPDSWRAKDRLVVTIEEWHMGEDCKLANACRPTPAPVTTTTKPPTTTTTKSPTAPTTTTTTTSKPPTAPTTTGTPAASSTPSPGSGCEVDGCEVCEGDSAARCARCREGYSLTDEKTCLAHHDGGVAAASGGAVAAAAVWAAVLLSVGLAA